MSEPHANLLVIDGNPARLDQLDPHFRQTGCEVETLASSVPEEESLVSRVRTSRPDICLVSTELPRSLVMSLTGEIRAMKTPKVGIMLIANRHDPAERLLGLESGADDYLTCDYPIRPLELRELQLRVRNLLGRLQAGKGQSLHEFAGWTLNSDRRELIAPSGAGETLSASELQLLLALVENAGQVMTRDQLMKSVRNRDWYPGDRYMDVLVARLRGKFRQHDQAGTYITTIQGRGYLFSGEG